MLPRLYGEMKCFKVQADRFLFEGRSNIVSQQGGFFTTTRIIALLLVLYGLYSVVTWGLVWAASSQPGHGGGPYAMGRMVGGAFWLVLGGIFFYRGR